MVNLHFHIANVHVIVKDNEKLDTVLKQLNLIDHQVKKIIMTNQEAIDLLNSQATQLAKVRTEVQKLVDAAQNQGNISPELEAAITSVRDAIQGVDDLNPDEVVNPEGETPQG